MGPLAGRAPLTPTPRRPFLRLGPADAAWNQPLRLRRPDRRTLLRRSALVVVAVLAALLVGVTTARTEAGFGPHAARYAVTLDGTATLDLGPLGTVQLDSPVPVLGLRVTVREIPAELSEVDPATTLASLSEDAQSYVQFFTAPGAAVEDVVRGLVQDAVQRATVVLLLGALAMAGVRVLLGAARRRELAVLVRRRRHALVGAGLVTVLVLALVPASTRAGAARPAGRAVSASVFAGTPLEGARVTGRLGGVVDTLGRVVVGAIRDNQEFYARADDALVAAWEERPDPEGDATLPSTEGGQDDEGQDDEGQDDEGQVGEAPAGEGPVGEGPVGEAPADEGPVAEGPVGEAPTDEAPADEGQVGGGEADEGGLSGGVGDLAPPGVPGASGSPRSSPSATAEQAEEPVTVVVVSDLHCNVGMAPLITTLVRLAGADLVVDAGDTTVDGTAVEDYCVRTFARAVPDAVPVVTSPGNHDSVTTSATYARAGATVLDGGVVEVAGLRILGDHDPAETRVGAGGTRSREPAVEVAARLAEAACADEAGVDLLLVHTPDVGTDVLDEGCAPAQISGHLHQRVGPEVVGQGVRYVSSSTAGATLGQPTIGPLRGTAELTVLRWDPVTRLFVDLRVVSVGTDAGASVSERLPWPALPPVDTVPGGGGAPPEPA
ncbi:metallophosphoesterase [Cellulomonas marina]|uniref:Predicted phosphoesterase n=1 Tax=Cellulomonas marina TaxID=988821 RepID=A0A1I0YRE7_9CELL|nr:metallophosphoesterase [Cellulomonas marina]GIG27560.1 hypothetical protein Cma02nite_01600 [Cellulomonas marina]SFB15781.1 Predicted phosphoesterase [Cellulomonas marina]